MKFAKICALALLCCGTFEFCLGLRKVWLPNLEWNTASNWQDLRVPSTGSHVVFPEEMRLSVGFPNISTMTLSGIELPKDGILALNPSAKIIVTEEKYSEHASVKTATWTRTGPLYWQDPKNWNVSNEAIPLADRIPCRNDIVILPSSGRVFSMVMPENRVKVKGVEIANEPEVMPQYAWRNLNLKREFHSGLENVEYSRYMSGLDEKCQEDTYGDIREEVCKIVKDNGCGPQACEKPLEVEGRCCFYCGARIVLSKSDRSPLFSIQRKVEQTLSSSGNQVYWYVRKNSDEASEILVAEKGRYTGLSSFPAIENLAAELKDDGIEISLVEHSGAEFKESSLPWILGPVFGVPLIILIALYSVSRYYGYSNAQLLSGLREVWGSARNENEPVEPKKNTRPFQFARFDNTSEANVDIGQPALPEEETEEKIASGSRFENPLYRSKKSIAGDMPDVEKLDITGPVSLKGLKKMFNRAKKADADSDEEVDLEIED